MSNRAKGEQLNHAHLGTWRKVRIKMLDTCTCAVDKQKSVFVQEKWAVDATSGGMRQGFVLSMHLFLLPQMALILILRRVYLKDQARSRKEAFDDGTYSSKYSPASA